MALIVLVLQVAKESDEITNQFQELKDIYFLLVSIFEDWSKNVTLVRDLIM